MTDSLPQFKKFFSTCSRLLKGESPQILSLIRKRYDSCGDDVRHSPRMVALLDATTSKMVADDKRLYVHLKDFNTQLKAWSLDSRGPSSGRKRKADTPKGGLAKLARIMEDSTSEGSDLDGKLHRALGSGGQSFSPAPSEPTVSQPASCSQSPVPRELGSPGSDEAEPTTSSRCSLAADSPDNASLFSAAEGRDLLTPSSHSPAVEEESASSVPEAEGSEMVRNDGGASHRTHQVIPLRVDDLCTNSLSHCSGSTVKESTQQSLAAWPSLKSMKTDSDDCGDTDQGDKSLCGSHTNGSSEDWQGDGKVNSHAQCLTVKQEPEHSGSATEDIKRVTPLRVADTKLASRTEDGKLRVTPTPISPHRSQDVKPANRLFPQSTCSSSGSLSGPLKIKSLGDAIHRLKDRLASQQQSAAAAVVNKPQSSSHPQPTARSPSTAHSQSTATSQSTAHSQSTARPQSSAVSHHRQSTAVSHHPQSSRNMNGEVGDGDTKHRMGNDDNDDDDDVKQRVVDGRPSDKRRKPASEVKHSPHSPSEPSTSGGSTGAQHSRFNARESEGEEEEEGQKEEEGGSVKERRHVRRLEKLLEKIRDEIEKVRDKELSLDDLDAEDSAYIYEDRLQKKFVKVWERLCQLKGRTTSSGRPIERRLKYAGARFPEINRKIEKFVNRPNVFPDYHDIRGIIKKVNTRSQLGLNEMQINSISKETFMDVGEALQSRRKADFISTFHCKQTIPHSSGQDPALFDDSLRQKLEENQQIGKSRLEGVIKKYTDLQLMLGDVDRGPSTSYQGPKSSKPDHPPKSHSLHQPKSPPCHGSKSPSHHQSKSPQHYQSSSPSHQSRSPSHHRSRSPVPHRSRSPMHHRSKSPSHHLSKSPSHDRSNSPSNHRSKSPLNHRSRSPLNHRSRSPLNHRSRSPIDDSLSDHRSNSASEHGSGAPFPGDDESKEDAEAGSSPPTLRKAKVVLTDCMREEEEEGGREEEAGREEDGPAEDCNEEEEEEMEENEDEDDGLNMIEMDIAEECHLLIGGGGDSQDNSDWPQQITDTTTTSNWPELGIVHNEASWSPEPEDDSDSNSDWPPEQNRSSGTTWSQDGVESADWTSRLEEGSEALLIADVRFSDNSDNTHFIDHSSSEAQAASHSALPQGQVSGRSDSVSEQDSVQVLDTPEGEVVQELRVQQDEGSSQRSGLSRDPVGHEAGDSETVWIEDSGEQPPGAMLSTPCGDTTTDGGVTGVDQMVQADDRVIITATGGGGGEGWAGDVDYLHDRVVVCRVVEVEVCEIPDSRSVNHVGKMEEDIVIEDGESEGQFPGKIEEECSDPAPVSVVIEEEFTAPSPVSVVIEEECSDPSPVSVVIEDEDANPASTSVVVEDGDGDRGGKSTTCPPSASQGAAGTSVLNQSGGDKTQGTWFSTDVIEIDASSVPEDPDTEDMTLSHGGGFVADGEEGNGSVQGGGVNFKSEGVGGDCWVKEADLGAAPDGSSPVCRSIPDDGSNALRTVVSEKAQSPAPRAKHSPENVSTVKTNTLHIGQKSRAPVAVNPDLRLPKCLQQSSDGSAPKVDSLFYPHTMASAAVGQQNGDSITIGSSDEEAESGQADVKPSLPPKSRSASKTRPDEDVIVLSDDD